MSKKWKQSLSVGDNDRHPFKKKKLVPGASFDTQKNKITGFSISKGSIKWYNKLTHCGKKNKENTHTH